MNAKGNDECGTPNSFVKGIKFFQQPLIANSDRKKRGIGLTHSTFIAPYSSFHSLCVNL